MGEDRKDAYLIIYDPEGNEVAQGEKGDKNIVLKGLKPNTTYLEGNFTVVYSSDNGISGHKYLPTFKTKPRLVSDFVIDNKVQAIVGENTFVYVKETEPSDATNDSVIAKIEDESIAKISGDGNIFTIQPIHAGTTTITYQTIDGSNITKEQILVVEDAPKLPVQPSDIKVDAGANSITISAL